MESQYIQGKTTIYDVQTRLLQAGNVRSMDGADRTERFALSQSRSRLQRISVPELSERSEWESFRDLFRALIHNDASLSNVERLYYLRTLVMGDAKQALESLQLTDDNYSIAWNALEERFEHRRLLVHNHLLALRGLKPTREESAKALQTLVDTLRRHRDQLRALDRPVDQWDDWFVSVAATAMDPATRRAWEDELEKLDVARPGGHAAKPGHEQASFDVLIKFLNSRCRSVAACSAAPVDVPSSRQNPNNARNGRTYATRSTPGNCVQCQANHYIGHCDDFVKLSPEEKKDIVTKSRLCFNCLRSGHVLRNCPSRSTCQTCKLSHHTLLHDCDLAKVGKRPGETVDSPPPTKVQKIAAATGEKRIESSVPEEKSSSSA